MLPQRSQLCQMLFLSFSASRHSCMTVQAHVQPSMLHVRTSSHAKEEILNQYLQQLTLYYSTQRVTFQAGHCWGKCLEVLPQLPPPSEWGWQRGPTQAWDTLWTTIPQASQSCQELLRCGCKSERGCTGRCKCVRAELPCTALCHCGGLCSRP